ncbi:carbohydrate-binding domain-containing protein [Planomicrobium sp. CPCC 101110]|uniref:carbohydrate-binding domain-containing protein n=1 Tax=Planomicrobium sp. CPCC 101110 TaxID=2599619 RepID=UPI0011B3DA8C|nr:carbohydrate-binding domain-containing protein [Planomicrobium sp. CPCC 101110]TWT27146.1 carbohydrate-binding domain-containing protein [Planomicrobium sp. CPCC 101110]
MIKKKTFKMAAVALSASLLFACSNKEDSDVTVASAAATEEVQTQVEAAVNYSDDDQYSAVENFETIQLNGTEADFDSSAAVIFDDNTLTIKAGGTYVLSGSLDNGQISIDSEDKKTVRLVLDGVEINSSDTSAINVVNAKKTVISLEEGTENVLSDGEEYVFEDSDADEPNAAIFSKDDLTINGSGRLVVNGNYNNGITSKDELKITGGDIQITAVDDGLMGRDLVAVKDGTIAIEVGGDGIKSSNDEEAAKGTIAIEGGKFSIVSGNDGIQSTASVYITDGAYTIAAGGGSPETIAPSGGMMRASQEEAETTDETAEETASDSAKGIKAVTNLAVSGGTFAIDSLDDAVHSDGDVAISGGEWTIAAGDDGIHANNAALVAGGTIEVAKSNEALEADNITVNDGTLVLTAADDGINVSGGSTMMPGGMARETDAAESSTTDEAEAIEEAEADAAAEEELESKLTVNGGFVSVNAAGDGLDSNGSIEITGGTVLVDGPTENMNGSLDYDGSLMMEGGLLIAAGSSGMLQAASEESAQSSVVMTFPETQAPGTLVHIEDSAGNEIATFAPAKEFQAIFISSPDLMADSSYTLFTGGTSTGTEANGLYQDGTYEGGTQIVDFTITETVSWVDENGITEAGIGSMGGGMRSGTGTPPEGGMGGMFEGLDEESKAKMQEITQQVMDGTLTQEEAEAHMAELGLEFPDRGAAKSEPAE